MAKTFNITIKESSSTIAKLIKQAIVREYSDIFTKAAKPIKTALIPLLKEAIEADETVAELITNGILNAHLGLQSPGTSIGHIIDIWTQTISVTATKVTLRVGNAVGKLKIGMVVADYNDVLNSSSAEYISKPSQTIIPWLHWLIDSDAKPRAIVVGYDIKFGSSFNRSRSGQAIMVRKDEETWFLPDEYKGIPDDNFVTRALNTINDDLVNIIEREIIKSA